jgi:transposase-like protein
MNQIHDTPNLPKTLRQSLESPLEIKMALIEHHMELARMLVREILDEEVCQLAGERYSRSKPLDGRYSRWGSNPGSVRIAGERVPVEVPRVRDNHAQQCHRLESYEALHDGVDFSDRLYDHVLLGLATGDYERVASEFVDGFGLSQSSASRSFQERSRKALEAFERRSLSGYDFVGLWIDGKSQAKEQIVIALGLTMQGEKVPLGFIQATTENSEAVKGLLRDIVGRGFSFEAGLLCVIDGAKALEKAVADIFGDYAMIQRCQWHKRENVVSYLNESDKESYRRRLQQAYQLSDHDEAREALLVIYQELKPLNLSAANSLMEGLDETLTLQQLGLFDLLGKSLKTTNCIENLNSQLNKYTGRVKHWKSSDQRHRWVAAALLEIEKKMRRIDHYKHLPLLRKSLQEAIEKRRNQ